MEQVAEFSLNPQQRGAAEHGNGPLLILAGAGTGKTRTLIARLAHLVKQGVAPERILLVTFSRRAADEMLRRAGEFGDPTIMRRVHAGTFHAMANRHLRIYGSALGLPPGFTVIDQSDAADLMNLVRNDQGHGQRKRFPRKDTLVSIYSRTVNAQLPLSEVLTKYYPWCSTDIEGVKAVFNAYMERKRAQDMLDYDDLLLFWRAACADQQIGPVLGDLYDHVLVDEYQDTNVLQRDILLSLRARNPNITVVGDDAQSIYSFRAATVRNILEFPADFPNCTTIPLEQNYRSTPAILALANEVNASATEGFSKRLWSDQPVGGLPILATCPDERGQCEAVCDTILRHLENGIALRSQAVLFRASHHSDELEVELRRRNIPFVKYGGLKFLEAAHVRDLLASLRIVDNPYDELAWFRVLQLLDGVGAATAQRVMRDLGVRPRIDGAASPLVTFGEHVAALPARAHAEATELHTAFRECEDGSFDPGAQVERLRVALEPLLRRRYDNAEVRLRDIDQLAHLAAGYSDRARLVAELTLDPPTSTGDFAGPPLLDDDYLILSTVHSAKGSEWRAVHVIHAADGMFPSDMATGDAAGVDEERRLFYVALTRAQEHLHIYAPLRYHHSSPASGLASFAMPGRSGHSSAGAAGDAHSYAQRTRFLPPNLDPLLEHRAVRSPEFDYTDVRIDLQPITHSVDQSIKSLW